MIKDHGFHSHGAVVHITFSFLLDRLKTANALLCLDGF